MSPLRAVLLAGATILCACNAVCGLDAVEVGGQGGAGTTAASTSAASSGSTSTTSGEGGTSAGGGGSGGGGDGGGGGSGGASVCPLPWDGPPVELDVDAFEVTAFGALSCNAPEGGERSCEIDPGEGALRANLEPQRVHAGQCVSFSISASTTGDAPSIHGVAYDRVGDLLSASEAEPIPSGPEALAWTCRVVSDVTLDVLAFRVVNTSGTAASLTLGSPTASISPSCEGEVPDCLPSQGWSCAGPEILDFTGDLGSATLYPETEDGGPRVSEVGSRGEGCAATRFVQPEAGSAGYSIGLPLGAVPVKGGECISARLLARGSHHITLTLNDESDSIRGRFGNDMDDLWSTWHADFRNGSGCQLPPGFVVDSVTLDAPAEDCGFLDIDRIILEQVECATLPACVVE